LENRHSCRAERSEVALHFPSFPDLITHKLHETAAATDCLESKMSLIHFANAICAAASFTAAVLWLGASVSRKVYRKADYPPDGVVDDITTDDGGVMIIASARLQSKRNAWAAVAASIAALAQGWAVILQW
jgi:hypothetical protein